MKKVLHVLEYSVPNLVGYTIRSKYIVDNQCHEAIEPVVITSPLQGKTGFPFQQFEEIDSIRYYRTGEFNKLNMTEALPLRLLRRYQYTKAYLKAIKWVARKEKAQIIHSHSSYLNGIRANKAARILGIPSVYEVRGLWQDTATVNVDTNPMHWKYRFVDYMDRKAMLGADRVVTISRQLRDELIQKGVPENRLFIVPNGVDTQIFRPRKKHSKIVEHYKLGKKVVFGFIGSIRRIEGLSLFLENLSKIIGKTKNICFMMVGDGDEVENLKKITRENNLQEYVIFTGQVDHSKILDYYSAIDIALYPRIDAKVNHKVTPLKILEAMAMEKVVVASDVGGLKELIDDDNNGLLFQVDDGDHLVKRCMDLIENPSLLNTIGKKARAWAVRERDWRKVIKLYNEVYSDLTSMK